MVFMKLGKELLCPFNRPCKKLGKEGNIEGKQAEMSLGSFGTPIHIKHIAYNLKNIEGDSHRNSEAKQMALQGKAIIVKNSCHGTAEKVVILEHKKNAKVANTADEKNFSLP
jgi:hypothetical protein